MRVLIFHGYLLRGTGSNVYNANLVQALARLGHDVHLLCQEREAASLGWVDAVGTWEEGSLEVRPTGNTSPGTGSITVYRPDIGGLLPVYVEDRYEGFRVKAFPALSDAELEAYIEANVAAAAEVDERIGGAEAALANHVVMGPLICARAGLRFVAKVHGSALSYTVIPNPRFLPHAREGMDAATAVLVGSRHSALSLWKTIRSAAVEAKTRLGPPGVDVEAFSPLPAGVTAATELRALAAELRGLTEAADFGRDAGEAAVAVERYAAADGPRIAFVGKLIVSKGCDLLIAAWPLIAAANPEARLLMVGFGEYRDGVEALWHRISEGDLDGAAEIATRGRGLEGGEEAPLEMLGAFLAAPPAGYREAARSAADTIDFPGRLEYGEVARVLRCSEAMVAPSTFPEAFGMVAAEAAAAGALPVCARHSGLAEVAEALGADLGAGLAELTSFELGPGAVAAIADRVCRWLALPEAERVAARATMVDVVRGHWSWESVADAVLRASRGALDELEPVPSR